MENYKNVPMSCYYCKGHTGQVVAEKDDMRFKCFGIDKRIMRCGSCGLVQLIPQWTATELDYLYSTYWQKDDFKGQTPKVKISKYLTKYLKPTDNILEVGCGHGDNLRYLRSKGFRVTGIDKAPTELGVKVDYKDLEVTGWDVIYAVHLFEHIEDPRSFIQWLKENGRKFILEIPSLDNPLMKLESYRKFCWYPYHLFFYDKETIKLLFPRARIELMQEYGIINHLRWLIKGKPGNWNPEIPVLDRMYKFILTKLGYGDTVVVSNA